MLKAYLIEIAIILIAICLLGSGGWVRHKQSRARRVARAIRLGGEPKPTAFLLLLV